MTHSFTNGVCPVVSRASKGLRACILSSTVRLTFLSLAERCRSIPLFSPSLKTIRLPVVAGQHNHTDDVFVVVFFLLFPFFTLAVYHRL